MTSFRIEETASLEIERSASLAEMYTLSPYVWREGKTYGLLLRVVNRSDDPTEKISRIHYGTSDNGLYFTLGDRPVIAPGPGADDKGGCEDPTLIIVEDVTYVYYSGWNQTLGRGQLLLAAGGSVEHLEKRGIAIPYTKEWENPKEATIVQAADGTWRLFFEYARDGASRVGLASAPSVDGPWTVRNSPFESRPGKWDDWHLSPGPVVYSDPKRPVMFYNGATRDAHWRIGWIAFDEECSRVIDRSDEPLITPPPGEPGDTDIAFVASAVQQGEDIFLYYSVADKSLVRATIRELKSAHQAQ
ncbi:MAG: glycoside hydrolase family 130 protein [Chloroflexota bacterium]